MREERHSIFNNFPRRLLVLHVFLKDSTRCAEEAMAVRCERTKHAIVRNSPFQVHLDETMFDRFEFMVAKGRQHG